MENRQKNLTKILIVSALCVVINFVGSTVARIFELPIYIDTIGTIFCGVTISPLWAALTGLISALLSSVTFDPTSLYFAPVQVLIGLLTGLFFKRHKFQGFRSVLAILVITVAGSMMSSIIATFVFSGITSSGSSYIVQIVHALGLNLLASVFSTQILTDLIDKAISFWLVFLLLKILPKRYLPYG